jgi:lysophospholipase L1-like esterase
MKHILCFGDSNTYGLVPGVTERYEWGTRWTSLLSDKIEKDGYRIIEEGLCGRTTVFDDPFREGRRGTQMLPLLLETHRPLEGIVLMLGTNDCKTIYKASADDIGKGIEELLGQIKEYAPESKVLLISPIHLGEKVWEDGYDQEFSKQSVQVAKELATVYKRIAAQHKVAYLNAADYAKSSEADQEHLNEEGHLALAQAIYGKWHEFSS